MQTSDLAAWALRADPVPECEHQRLAFDNSILKEDHERHDYVGCVGREKRGYMCFSFLYQRWELASVGTVSYGQLTRALYEAVFASCLGRWVGLCSGSHWHVGMGGRGRHRQQLDSLKSTVLIPNAIP